MCRKSTIFEPRLDTSKTPKCAYISASKTIIKNRLGSSKCSPLRTCHVKFGVSSMFRLSCRWGVVRKCCGTSYNRRKLVYSFAAEIISWIQRQALKSGGVDKAPEHNVWADGDYNHLLIQKVQGSQFLFIFSYLLRQ